LASGKGEGQQGSGQQAGQVSEHGQTSVWEKAAFRVETPQGVGLSWWELTSAIVRLVC